MIVTFYDKHRSYLFEKPHLYGDAQVDIPKQDRVNFFFFYKFRTYKLQDITKEILHTDIKRELMTYNNDN